MSDSLLTSPLNASYAAPATRPGSYHDFGGLATLRGEAAQGSGSALRETAKQFETYFIQQMMKSMRETIERSELTENSSEDTFQDMMDKEVAAKMSERGSIGLADMIERSMTQHQTPSAQEVLASRGAMSLRPAAPAHGLAAPAAPALSVPRTGGAMPLNGGAE